MLPADRARRLRKDALGLVQGERDGLELGGGGNTELEAQLWQVLLDVCRADGGDQEGELRPPSWRGVIRQDRKRLDSVGETRWVHGLSYRATTCGDAPSDSMSASVSSLGTRSHLSDSSWVRRR